MAGVLGQTNATLLEVISASPLSDSFVSDSFGSGESTDQESKWSGHVGIWFAPVRRTRESSTDGRDVVDDRRLHMPIVCPVGIGDQLRVLEDGEEKTFSVSGVTKIGNGLELTSGQYLQVQIEVL
jgi:hypothetical protein